MSPACFLRRLGDARFVALGTTTDGDLAPTISVLDVAQRRLLPDRIPDLLTTTSGARYEVTWLPDGSGGTQLLECELRMDRCTHRCD